MIAWRVRTEEKRRWEAAAALERSTLTALARRLLNEHWIRVGCPAPKPKSE
jgi:hypothetical protein